MAAPPGRRQSTRQVSRTSRPTNYYARNNLSGRNLGDGPSNSNSNDAQPGFFPAIQHFTDAVDALPKEVIRHFSMLREVESKLHGPDELIRRYATAITNLPDPARARQPPQAYFPSLSAHNSVDGSRPGSVLASDNTSTSTNAIKENAEADRERQALFYNLTMNIAIMAPALDEKIAVLSTANQTLRRQLDRMISSYHHIPDEISEEARLGNPKHWAYVTEKETKKVPERPSRREIVSTNTLAAAAAAVEGEFASRSEARREAVAARKGRAQQVDSDFDDRPPPKKGPGKAKKPVPIEDPKSVGLGIANGIAGPGKRKKVPGGVPMERTASGALSNNGKGHQPSPRDTPDVVPKKRAKPGPAPKKPRVPGVASPYLASSPVVGAFAAKEPVPRPAQARGRVNSTATSVLGANLDSSKHTQPPSSQSNRPMNPNGTLSAYEQLQASVAEAERAEALKPLPMEARPMKNEEVDTAGDDVSMPDVDAPPPPQIPTVTRAGRTSKTATPLSSTFPPEPVRRAARTTKENNNSSGANTGSHASSESGSRGRKKTIATGVESTATSIRADVSDLADEEDVEAEEVDEGEGNEGEPKYCYCNDVSYGEMVACDNESCEREWFHLKCAGLTKAPDVNTKWYCDDCKVSMGQSAKRSRPVSRRAE